MTRLVLAAATAVLMAGCVPVPGEAGPYPPGPYVSGPVITAYPPLPPPRFEPPPPPPPRISVVWQPGHWQWDGVRYGWIGGHYVERLRGAGRWVPGHWAPRPGGYVWERGHWV